MPAPASMPVLLTTVFARLPPSGEGKRASGIQVCRQHVMISCMECLVSDVCLYRMTTNQVCLVLPTVLEHWKKRAERTASQHGQSLHQAHGRQACRHPVPVRVFAPVLPPAGRQLRGPFYTVHSCRVVCLENKNSSCCQFAQGSSHHQPKPFLRHLRRGAARKLQKGTSPCTPQ